MEGLVPSRFRGCWRDWFSEVSDAEEGEFSVGSEVGGGTGSQKFQMLEKGMASLVAGVREAERRVLWRFIGLRSFSCCRRGVICRFRG